MLVVWIVVLGLILFLLNYLVDAVPMDPNFKRIAKIAITVIGILILILMLLNFAGLIDGGLPRLR
jgi:hypothetical protein